MALGLLVVGPQATGKKLAFEVVRRCPAMRPGSVAFRSLPLAAGIKEADRYVLTSRELAARSLLRRDRDRRDLPGVTLEGCWAVVEEGREQAERLLAGADVFRLDYRRMVEAPEATISALAEWLQVDPWPIEFEIYDGDEGLI